MQYNKPTAYKGDKPYIFISYAHKDSNIIFPIISRIINDGYRVWYDEGIILGSNWDVHISSLLDKSSNVLAFLSKSYIKSQNCRDELALSRIKGKPMNIIYIDDEKMSPGMKMRYGRIQALYYQNMNEKEFYEKLYSSTAIQLSK